MPDRFTITVPGPDGELWVARAGHRDAVRLPFLVSGAWYVGAAKLTTVRGPYASAATAVADAFASRGHSRYAPLVARAHVQVVVTPMLPPATMVGLGVVARVYQRNGTGLPVADVTMADGHTQTVSLSAIRLLEWPDEPEHPECPHCGNSEGPFLCRYDDTTDELRVTRIYCDLCGALVWAELPFALLRFEEDPQ